MKINLIVAMSNNRGIGIDGRLPWHIPEDLKHFKQITTGHTVLMGRKTFEDIGRPLPNRRNLVLSRDPNFHPEGVEVIRSPEEIPEGIPVLYVIGGSAVYREFLPRADSLWITRVDALIDADTFFPNFDTEKWSRAASTAVEATVDVPYRYWFEHWIRNKGVLA